VNLPEVSQRLLNVLNSQNCVLDSQLDFTPDFESLSNDCWNHLHADAKFQTLKQQCTRESEELCHQQFLTHAIGLVIEFLGDKCGLTLRDTSAADYPVAPQHKVDLSLVVKHAAMGRVQWLDMVLGIEVKPEQLLSNIAEGQKQTCDVSSQLFYTDPLRTFVPAFVMTATKLRFYQFTRSGNGDLCSYHVNRTDELPLFEVSTISSGFRLLLHTLMKSPARLGYSILRTLNIVDTMNVWLSSSRRPKFKMTPIKEPSRAGKPCLLKLEIVPSRFILEDIDDQRSLEAFDFRAPYPSTFLAFRVRLLQSVNNPISSPFFHVFDFRPLWSKCTALFTSLILSEACCSFWLVWTNRRMCFLDMLARSNWIIFQTCPNMLVR
jgi:hypothetical protein